MNYKSQTFKAICKGLRHTQYDVLATLLYPEHVGKLAKKQFKERQRWFKIINIKVLQFFNLNLSE